MVVLFAVLLAVQDPADAADRFRRHVEALASDEMKGRDNGTDEGRRAAQYVADRLEEAGARPAGPGGSWFQDWKAKAMGRELEGRNVIGRVEGSDPQRRGEYVIVNAHHDARGILKGRVQNGADDNASGCAMVIELARALARSPTKRSVLFVTFDAEEDGLIGSREFVESGLFAADTIVADICFDLVGGDFLPWETSRVYALGAESSERVTDAVKDATVDGLEVVRSGVYLIEPFGPSFARSDYASFRRRKIPFVFISTATPWYYHTEHDDAGRLNYAKMVRIAAWCERVVRNVADGGKPEFVEKPETDVKREAAMMREMAEKLLASEDFTLTDRLRADLERSVAALKEVEAADAVPLDARGRLQRTMVAVFQSVAANPRK